MNAKIFYDKVRTSVFGGKLSTSQVAGLNSIIEYADRQHINTEFLAYALATTAWETAYTMQPIHERGVRSYFNKYEPATKIGRALGNTKPGDGYLFRGRGYVQLTGRSNYTRASKELGVDLVGNPDAALRPDIALCILFAGMSKGWFTGKSFTSYLDGIDEGDAEDLREFTNARRIVNGTDKAAQIGRIALTFENALRAAGRLDVRPAGPQKPTVEAPNQVRAPQVPPKAHTPPDAVSEEPVASPLIRLLRLLGRLLLIIIIKR